MHRVPLSLSLSLSHSDAECRGSLVRIFRFFPTFLFRLPPFSSFLFLIVFFNFFVCLFLCVFLFSLVVFCLVFSLESFHTYCTLLPSFFFFYIFSTFFFLFSFFLLTPLPAPACSCFLPFFSPLPFTEVAQPVLANVSSDRYNLTVVDAQHDGMFTILVFFLKSL